MPATPAPAVLLLRTRITDLLADGQERTIPEIEEALGCAVRGTMAAWRRFYCVDAPRVVRWHRTVAWYGPAGPDASKGAITRVAMTPEQIRSVESARALVHRARKLGRPMDTPAVIAAVKLLADVAEARRVARAASKTAAADAAAQRKEARTARTAERKATAKARRSAEAQERKAARMAADAEIRLAHVAGTRAQAAAARIAKAQATQARRQAEARARREATDAQQLELLKAKIAAGRTLTQTQADAYEALTGVEYTLPVPARRCLPTPEGVSRVWGLNDHRRVDGVDPANAQVATPAEVLTTDPWTMMVHSL